MNERDVTPTRGRTRGQAMVEFALVAPMLFILLFAIIEGARFTFYYEMLNNATREGSRYAIVHGENALDGCNSGPLPVGSSKLPCDPPGDNVRAAVRNAALSLVDSGTVSIPSPMWTPAGTDLPDAPDGTTGPGNNSRGSYVTVFVNYTYPPIIPLLPSITISARSSLVINN